ncbi:hypothetical protein CLV92_1288 [Kineococcus xinjiangensis]|uniref:Uncharacterized protein n=1 Tax=Kineococcus xinjiangensis TaxID=512762 RepID=A0A2S6IBV4_9ACTN|nr:RNA-binding protein [Kineococcus xinjiangensis]PPK90178.1 hypothetical protein CLV92_1288 [Kineococcus xinjiangensis]
MDLPFVWLVTMYDPVNRNADGSYTVRLQVESDRGPVEAAYVQAVADFAADSGVTCLAVREPFLHLDRSTDEETLQVLAGVFGPELSGLYDGALVDVAAALELVRLQLRGWDLRCTLEDEGRFVIHVGVQQRLYLSSYTACERALARTAAAGLFPEHCSSNPASTTGKPLVERAADAEFWRRVDDLVFDRGEVLVEEHRVAGRVFHRVTPQQLPSAALEERMRPRVLLSVWPGLTGDVDVVRECTLAALEDSDHGHLVWIDAAGRLHQRWVDGEDPDVPDVAVLLREAVAASWVESITPNGPVRPLLQAARLDTDGVLRARWTRWVDDDLD